MIYFNCDYNEGAHPLILDRLYKTNMEQTAGYGEDKYCAEAREVICGLCKKNDVGVHFLVGGTQANLTVIAAALRPHQGVIAALTGHINVHETGAIESGGHKVLAVPSADGKVTAQQVENLYNAHVLDESFEHTVQPKMVYISNPTELGTIYTRDELKALSECCSKNELYLFMDGARLGYGLTAEENDLTLECIADLCDVFYIGGTKNGALFGEAVVISNPVLNKDFRYIIKQKGGMLAKGRLLGIQFLTLFEEGLYFALGKQANVLAEKIRTACRNKGYSFLVESSTNQIFVIMPDEKLSVLGKKYIFSYQQRIDELHSAVRICTSWATTEEQAEELAEDIRRG